MAFTEAERVQIRRWLGVPAIFVQAEPRLETAITTVQAVSEGGSRPDNTTELAIRGYLAQLATIETKWQAWLDEMEAHKVDEIVIDPIRGLAGLFKIGRNYVGHIADALDHPPVRDVFTTAPTVYRER